MSKRTYGETVRLRRIACYMNQRQLAELAGVNRRTIQNVESNHGKPHVSTIALINAALDEREMEIEELRAEKEDEQHDTASAHLQLHGAFRFHLPDGRIQ